MASNSSNSGSILKRANPSTIQDKFLVGYQGWFTCPGDGEPVGPGHHGWLHWFNYPIPDGGRPNTDVWPDVSSYSPSELFPAPGLKTKSGDQTFLFSSRNPKTVQRHFHWMAEHGIDGAFLQRFAGQCDLESGNEGIRRIRDEVGQHVREAAEREGRVFAIMYDVSGVPPDRIQSILERDWLHLVHALDVLDSPNYLREKGKPVIALWGFGFENSGHTPALVRAITQYFRNNTPGGVYIMGGAPAHWRTAESDADRNPGFLDMWLSEFDAISPWTVGRYRTEQEADKFAESMMQGDSTLIKKQNEDGSIRKVDYIPVVLPGGSGYNLSEGKWGFNDIKRDGGKFLWKQIYNARRLGVRTIYGAMWDEYDEGTAFMPIVEHKRDLPESTKYPFLALDEDGHDVPSDWYMRICGFAAEGLRNERRILETFPVKELQDYWSSRPRYEDVNPKSQESLSSANEGKAGGSRVDPGDPGGGQTYQEWLALQREEREEVPPPPYTLEGVEESTDPIPASQTVTTTSTRAAAVATTPEVSSAVVQNVHVVANARPVASSSRVVVSPPAVDGSHHPASAAPASQEQVYPKVAAQSPHLSPPVQGYAPRPSSPGNVHHLQSRPSSQGHSGTSQYPQLHQAHSPQSFLPAAGWSCALPAGPPQSYPPQTPQQPYAPPSGPPAQSYYPPFAGQVDQPYLPSGGVQPAHSYNPPQTPHPHLPAWGQPESYLPGGSLSYQAATGHPPPTHGYISPSPQSYPNTSGGPVRVDGSSFQDYTYNPNTSSSSHNQSQDPVATLVNDFGRQTISRPSGGSGVPSGGRLPSPPPLHPAHTGRPSRPSTTTQTRPPSRSQNQHQSQSGHHPVVAPLTQESSTPPQTRPNWPPAEWDSDTPPVKQFSSHPEHRPSGGSGANLTRPQTFSASSSGGSALRPTLSMNNKPPSRPNTTSNTTPPGRRSPAIAELAYSTHTHDHSNHYGTGHSTHGQHGSQIGFAQSQYNPSYISSSHASTTIPTMSWPGPGSPPHSSNVAFAGGHSGYSGPGSAYGSGQYPSRPSFPSSSSSSPPGGVAFPQVSGGDGAYFGSSSGPFSNQSYGGGSSSEFAPSSSSGYAQSQPASWMSTGPQFQGPSMNYQSSSSSSSGALGFALNAVDKVAGSKKRKQVENLAHTSSQLFSKFTK